MGALVGPGDWPSAPSTSSPGTSGYQLHDAAENCDPPTCLSWRTARAGVEGARQVYMPAADMGGMGFIENNKAACMMSVLISTHMLKAAHEAGVERYFTPPPPASTPPASRLTRTSPRCARRTPIRRRRRTATAGRSSSERMCRHFAEDSRVYHPGRPLPQRVRPARHLGGRAGRRHPRRCAGRWPRRCLSGDHRIEIWGDGLQTRSFMRTSISPARAPR
ncbi:hypothetical protein LT493_12335 [Streptomyces tricolor]|nr:hypothetical protein [Streptomyces tricolor]